eukprot:scaffold73226_cov45-Phaeocystis_antarctica.AAC.2
MRCWRRLEAWPRDMVRVRVTLSFCREPLWLLAVKLHWYTSMASPCKLRQPPPVSARVGVGVAAAATSARAATVHEVVDHH